mmetsp:Transcript_56291/g.119685  ORF Transcript_56291/g.119685 Transcript_56291/m.119685 type:complete len:504 (+) Transcript_56291:130-1641(+)
MLVTYHKENEFTKGIILNRPSNLFLGDEDFLDEDGEPYLKAEGNNRTENLWRIWFGGDVRSLYSDDTEIICLHSVDNELARNVSEVLLNNVLMTNYEGAIQIINAGQAEARDFWMFAGYAGWTGGQLLDELNRESWYMVSADSETVWKELVSQRDEVNSDPRDAGLKTWSSLMGIIGKENEAKVLSESFADLTLKEWAANSILFNSTAGSVEAQGDISSLGDGSAELSDIINSFSSAPDTLDKIVKLAVNANNGLAGSLLRGSADHRSPFLLSDQKFHKSVLLILQDDDQLTIGVMLNHPRTKTRPITLPTGRTVQIPIRYGGSFGIPGVTDQPTIFLHAKSKLKERSVGEPVGRSDDDSSKIWICTEEQAITAIAEGHASHRDFMCIEGLSIWNKDAGMIEGGILGEMVEGKFELVNPSFTEEIWVTLLAQASLSIDTIDRNCRLAVDAWGVAGKEEDSFPPYVYDSSITVSELSDDASRYWIEAFLLGGVISAAGKYSAFE